MKIDFEFLKNNPEAELTAPVKWENESLEINGEVVYWSEPLKGELVFRTTGNVIRMYGKMEGVLRVSCARCLKEFNIPLQSSFTVDLTQGKTGEDTGETYNIQGNEIDIEPILMEQILFNLPLGLVCSTECQGLCPVCGQDLNLNSCQCQATQIDPRWDALKKLMEGKEG
ncbi:MAG: YceD family protein [Methylocystaceae bacterium]